MNIERTNLSIKDREDFGNVFNEYLQYLYNGALRLTGNPVEAEDLVSETFLRGLRFYTKFKAGTSVKSWLFKIMYNLFINEFHRRRSQPMILELKEEMLYPEEVRNSASSMPKEDFFHQLPNEEIQQAMDNLPEDFRRVIILSDIEGFTYKEISEIMGCPVGTVRSRLARAREILFSKLYDYARSRGYLKGKQDVNM